MSCLTLSVRHASAQRLMMCSSRYSGLCCSPSAVKNAAHVYITNLSVTPALSSVPLLESDYNTHPKAFFVSVSQAAGRDEPLLWLQFYFILLFSSMALAVMQYPAKAGFISVCLGGKNLITFDGNGVVCFVLLLLL